MQLLVSSIRRPHVLRVVPDGRDALLDGLDGRFLRVVGNGQRLGVGIPVGGFDAFAVGGGFDAFLAAKQVGASGRVIGVDMTPEMIAKARANATKLGAANVEFRLGEIERLPVDAGTADVIMSNCVINLSPDKASVFEEAYRVLKPGGRLAISDVVLMKALPADIGAPLQALVGCVSGAARVDEIEAWLRAAGFEEIAVVPRPESRAFIRDWIPGSGVEDYVASATIEARKKGVKTSCCAPGCCAEPNA